MVYPIKCKGWWYISKIDKLSYIDNSNHIKTLYDNYKDFGITEEELDNWHKKWNIKSLYDCEKIGDFDEKERELISLALKKGNFRIKECFSQKDMEKSILIEFSRIYIKELIDFLLLNKLFFEKNKILLSCIENNNNIEGFNNIEEIISYCDN